MPKIEAFKLKLAAHPPQGAVLTAVTRTGRDYEVQIGRANLRGLAEAMLRIAEAFESRFAGGSHPGWSSQRIPTDEAGPGQSTPAHQGLSFVIGLDMDDPSLVALTFTMPDPDKSGVIQKVSLSMPTTDAEVMISGLQKVVGIVKAEPSARKQ